MYSVIIYLLYLILTLRANTDSYATDHVNIIAPFFQDKRSQFLPLHNLCDSWTHDSNVRKVDSSQHRDKYWTIVNTIMNLSDQ